MHQYQEKHHLPGFAQVLILEGLLKEDHAREALNQAAHNKQPFVHHLVVNNILKPRDIARIGSKDFGVPFLDLNSYDTSLLPVSLVSENLITRHQALPLFRRGDHLYIAVSDPTIQAVINEIKFHTGLRVHCIIVEHDKLLKHIEEVLSAKEDAALGEYLGDADASILSASLAEEAMIDSEQEVSADDAPIVRFVTKTFMDAIYKGASDIHFEPYEDSYRIRFRIDGLLHVHNTPPPSLTNRISSRIKIMAQLDISERRTPQDGRFKLNLSNGKSIDFRVSTCPTTNGEKIVTRILDSGSTKLGIDSLGFNEIQRQNFLKVISQPQGMVLVTGPTGSGKTLTLYTALSILNDTQKNISTAEDPVEIKVPGVNQVNINLKAGLTFSSALRAFLRQDPDIIMVGEMRDLETAEIGIKAAQTGHLVLSTLHTNSAPETLSRLKNMGVAPYNIASSVSLIIAQRLARCLCNKCKKATQLPHEVLIEQGFSEELTKKIILYKPVGCDECTGGYKGRIGLFEVLVVSKDIAELIMTGGNVLDITKQAEKEGMITIRQSGLQKVEQGLTSLDEINRVTKD